MLSPRTLVLECIVCVLAFCYGAPTNTLAQTSKPADTTQNTYDRTLQQLLIEVRELRLTIQKAATNQTRFQMLIERVRVQQGSVDSIGRQLENLRSQLADLRASKPQFEQQVKDAEQQLERTTDPNGRPDIESRIKQMKADLARFGSEEERLRNRESLLETDLQTSQAKLSELNSQLDALFNEMKTP